MQRPVRGIDDVRSVSHLLCGDIRLQAHLYLHSSFFFCFFFLRQSHGALPFQSHPQIRSEFNQTFTSLAKFSTSDCSSLQWPSRIYRIQGGHAIIKLNMEDGATMLVEILKSRAGNSWWLFQDGRAPQGAERHVIIHLLLSPRPAYPLLFSMYRTFLTYNMPMVFWRDEVSAYRTAMIDLAHLGKVAFFF